MQGELRQWQLSTSVPGLTATLRKENRLGEFNLKKRLLLLSLRRA
jgi:hypothetical protein